MTKNSKRLIDLSNMDNFIHEAIGFMIKQFSVLKKGMDNKDFGEIKEAQMKTLLEIIDKGMSIRQKMFAMSTEGADESPTVRGGYKLNNFSIPKKIKQDGRTKTKT